MFTTSLAVPSVPASSVGHVLRFPVSRDHPVSYYFYVPSTPRCVLDSESLSETKHERGISRVSHFSSVYEFNAGLRKCAREGRMVDAVQLFDKMPEAGYNPDINSYKILIQGFGRQRNMFENVTQIFEKFRDSGCPPDLPLCTELICIYGNGAQLKMVETVVQYMNSVSMQPDCRALTSLLHAYAQAGLWAEAENTLRQMEKGEMADDIVYSVLVNAYIKAGMVDQVESVISRLNSKGIKPTAVFFGTVINAYSKAGNPDKAREFLQQSQAAGCKSTLQVHTNLIEACARNSQSAVAEEILGEMKASGLRPDSVVYCVLIKGYCQQGLLGDAERIFRTMQDDKCKPTIYVYNSLIHGYAKKWRLGEAQWLLRNLQGSGLTADVCTYNTLISMYIKAGKRQQAEELYKRMQKLGCKPDDITFKLLHRAYLSSQNSLDAEKILLDQRRIRLMS